MLVKVVSKGSFNNTFRFFQAMKERKYYSELERLAKKGVSALSDNTPVDTGKTASSWDYKITETGDSVKIEWTNSNLVKGIPVAILIQYGHGTRSGRYVEGIDYINPALKPIFDEIEECVWKGVRDA